LKTEFPFIHLYNSFIATSKFTVQKVYENAIKKKLVKVASKILFNYSYTNYEIKCLLNSYCIENLELPSAEQAQRSQMSVRF